jgi:hypothetical protein
MDGGYVDGAGGLRSQAGEGTGKDIHLPEHFLLHMPKLLYILDAGINHTPSASGCLLFLGP